jgi:hypothetical protein
MIRFNRSTGLVSASGLLICALLFASVYTANAESDYRLGTAASFGVLAGSTVTNTGSSSVSTNVGVWDGSAITGFPPGVYGGALHEADAVAQQAQTDLVTAYNTLAGLPCDFDLTDTDLGNQVLEPGVYCYSSSAQLTGPLVLDTLGLEDPLFVFKIGSELTTASDSSVSFVGGTSCNVYWQVGSSATLGTGTAFVGNIVALTSITLNTGATLSGRALARNGAVTLDTNTITDPVCATADEPTPTDVPPTETPVPATATSVPATSTSIPATSTSVPASSTSIPATSTSVPATSTPTDLPATVAPGSGNGSPEAAVPVATATQPESQLTSTPTGTEEQTPSATGTAEQTPSATSTVEQTPSATGTAEQTPSATAETHSTATVAVSTPTAQAPVAWPTSTAVPTEGPGGSVTFPNTGTQGPVALNTNSAMSTTNLVVIMALILLATAALAVTVDRRSRS